MDVIQLILSDEKHYRSVCKNVTKGNYLQHDLYQMFFEKVLLNIDKFNKANEEGRLISYCTSAIRNLWNNRGRNNDELFMISNNAQQPETIKSIIEPEIKEYAISELKLLYYSGSTIQRNQAEITMKVINMEGRTNITKASKEMNKSYGVVYSAVRNTSQLIKQKI